MNNAYDRVMSLGRVGLAIVLAFAWSGCINGVTGLIVEGRAGAQYTLGAEEPEIGSQLGFSVGIYYDPMPLRELRVDWAGGLTDATSPVAGGDLSLMAAGADIGMAYRPFGPFGSEFELRWTGLYGTVKYRPDGAENYEEMSGAWAHGLALGYGYQTISMQDAIGVRLGLDWQTILAHVDNDGGQEYLSMGPIVRVAILFPFSSVDSPEIQAWIDAENADTHRQFEEMRAREQQEGEEAQRRGEEQYRYNQCLNTPGCHMENRIE